MKDFTTVSTDPPLRQCSKCKEWFPSTLDYFCKNASRPSGLRTSCKKCDALQREAKRDEKNEKSRKRYEENKDRINEKHREYYRSNPQKQTERHKKYSATNKEKLAKKSKKFYEANKDKIREQQHARYEANKERIAEYHHNHYKATQGASQKKYGAANRDKNRERGKKYKAANPEKGRASMHRRHARKRALPDTLTSAQWENALSYWHGGCAYCGRPAGLFHVIAMDHFIPLSSSDCPGTVVHNCLPACHYIDGCNSSKGKKDPYAWIYSKFGKPKAAKILKRIKEYFEWAKNQ